MSVKRCRGSLNLQVVLQSVHSIIMPGIILYGPGESAKRSYLINLKSQFEDNQTIDLRINSIKELSQALISQSLFVSNKRLIIGENVPKNFDLSQIKLSDPDVTLALLTPETTTLLKDAKNQGFQVLEFSGEKELTAFAYLDYLLEGKKEALSELYRLLEVYGGMYVLSMVYYALRRNLTPLPASSFAQNKIKKQRQRFSNQDFVQLYHETLATESAFKEGLIDEVGALTRLTQYFIGYSPS